MREVEILKRGAEKTKGLIIVDEIIEFGKKGGICLISTHLLFGLFLIIYGKVDNVSLTILVLLGLGALGAFTILFFHSLGRIQRILDK